MADVDWEKVFSQLSAGVPPIVPEEGDIPLSNGCHLYWKNGEQGREYFSDEIGGGVHVWHTALIDPNTLLAAILQEAKLNKLEREIERRFNDAPVAQR